MRNNLVAILSIILSLGLVGRSFPAHLNLIPKGTDFTLKGDVMITVGSDHYSCRLDIGSATYADEVHKGNVGAVKSVGASYKKCPVSFFGFPWDVALVSKTGGMFRKVYYANENGVCGGGELPFTITKSGYWIFSGGIDGCGFSGDMKSDPKMIIEKDPK
jgi:hypothetical protein